MDIHSTGLDELVSSRHVGTEYLRKGYKLPSCPSRPWIYLVECRPRSAFTYMQFDLTLRFLLLYHQYLSTQFHPVPLTKSNQFFFFF